METGGFAFYTEKDAKLAEAEQRKIDYLEARIDYTRPESILHVYEKAIHERLFKTPIGLMYLKKLQDFLLKQPQIAPERITAIPLDDTYDELEGQKKLAQAERRREQEVRRREKETFKFHMSMLLNVLLVLAICAMFYITMSSDQPNILNYERAITNRYAAWDQELTRREQAIREKERELDIDGLNVFLEQ